MLVSNHSDRSRSKLKKSLDVKRLKVLYANFINDDRLKIIKETYSAEKLNIRAPLYCSLVTIILRAIIVSLSPLALKFIVDNFSTKNYLHAFCFIISYVVLLFLARLCQSFLVFEYGVMWRKLHQSMLIKAYEKLIQMPHQFYIERQAGSVDKIVSEGASGMRSALSAFLFGIAPVLLQVVAITTILIMSGYLVFTIVLLIFAVSYAWLFSAGARTQKAMQRDAAQFDISIAGLATDAFMNHEQIKVFTGERSILDKMSSHLIDGEGKWREFFSHQLKERLLISLLFACTMITMLIISFCEIKSGLMTVGSFVLVNAYIIQVISPLEQLGDSSREIGRGLTYMGILSEILRSAPKLAERSAIAVTHGNALSDAPFSVSVNNVCFAYKEDEPLLTEISFSIPAGHRLAIVGPTGSGKSTLAKLLLGLVSPSKGSILYNNINMAELDIREVRRRIGFVPQDTILFHDTIKFNVGFGLEACAERDLENAARISGIQPLIARSSDGWNAVVGERGMKISGGEKQRVAIARALVRKPSLFIFDEATSSLDVATEKEVLKNFMSVSSEITSIFITHRIDFAREADTIIVMERGCIIENGTHDELIMLNGAYKRMQKDENVF